MRKNDATKGRLQSDLVRRQKGSFVSTLKEGMQLLALFLLPKRNRASAVYKLLGTHNNLAEQSLFLNLGYWKEAQTYDDACAALTHEMGEAAEFKHTDVVLDCGFGFGDQDAYWVKHFPLESIKAINISEHQITYARSRFSDPKIEFSYGSATEIPFDDTAFEKVVALESAFHFDTRQRFFRESYRVLKKGGSLTTADVIAGTQTRGFRAFMMEFLGRAFWQIPKSNMIDAAQYKDQLEDAGFVNIKVRNISREVFIPFKDFARTRTLDAEVKARLHPWLRAMWRAPHQGLAIFEYVIVTAEKP
jgi:ubiquinone/menaquinone biosynthesis C-methylase UbiE